MNFGQSFRLAIKSLRTSKMRALLTMLGIIIGVAAVIIITSLGNGMKNYMNKQFDQLGAKRKDIRSQFIIEAGTTSAVGGVIGIVLGIIMANILTNVIAFVLKTGNDGFVAIPTLTGIAVSFGVSVGVGILFGYLPANKAARLNPIDALRYD